MASSSTSRRFKRVNTARPVPSTPASSPPAPLPPANPWQTSRWCRDAGGLPSPLSTPPTTPSPPATPPSSPPRTCRALQASNWRCGAGALPPPPPPPLLEWVIGRVVLLPDQSQVPTACVIHKEAPGNPWNHPQVITKIWEENGIKLVKLRTCTSFGGVGITAKKVHQRHYFVEAYESQLTGESDAFCKQTYVNCSPGSEFNFEFQHLLAYSGTARNAIQFSAAALDSFNKHEWVRRDSFF